MILIISETNDLTTDKVIEWLVKGLDYKFVRINEKISKQIPHSLGVCCE